MYNHLITFVIVVYNINVDKSKCIEFLIKNKKSIDSILVCDNSTIVDIKAYNYKFCNDNKMGYLDMEGNSGISRAYNEAIKTMDTKTHWYVFLDQDTLIDNKYINNVYRCAIDNKFEVYIPYIYANNVLLSPSKINKFHISVFKNSNILNSTDFKNLTFINTGVLVKSSVYSNIGLYDERFFLDYVDHNFVRLYKMYYKDIGYLDSEIEQSFSGYEIGGINKDFNRFNIYLKDFYQFCNVSLLGRVYYFAKVIYRAAKLSLVYRNTKFIRHIIRNESAGDRI